MAKWISVVDTWIVMIVISFFAAVGLLSAQGLLLGHGSSSWENAILCLVESGLGFVLFLSLKAPRRALWIRLVMVIAATLVVWFQPTPWLSLNDSALVRHSFEREFIGQRLVQVGAFLLFAAPFVGLGVVRWIKGSPDQSAGVRASERKISLIIIVLVGLACGLASRLIGGSAERLAMQAVILSGVTLFILFELARRAVRADNGIRIALVAIAIGMPLLSFWR
jgi:hypothetical protein